MNKTVFRFLVSMMCFAAIFLLISCSKKNQKIETNGTFAEEHKTVAQALVRDFMSSAENESIMSVAQKISESEMIKTTMVIEDMTGAEFIQGFDSKIYGYSKVSMIAPMIGSIPFISYIFESDNAEVLEEELRLHADLRWNICVEAEEMLTCVKGNRVFFVMSPFTFDE